MLKFLRRKTTSRNDPNALSVEVVGTSMRKEDDCKDQEQKLFVSYRIQVKYRGKQWEVLRRFRQFEDLNNALETYAFISMKGSVPKFPSSKAILTKKLSSKLIKKRRNALEKYLTQVASSNDYSDSPILLSFLEVIQEDVTTKSIIRDARRGKRNVEPSMSAYNYSQVTSSVRHGAGTASRSQRRPIGVLGLLDEDDDEFHEIGTTAITIDAARSGSGGDDGGGGDGDDSSDDEWRRRARRNSPSSVPPMPRELPPPPPPTDT